MPSRPAPSTESTPDAATSAPLHARTVSRTTASGSSRTDPYIPLCLPAVAAKEEPSIGVFALEAATKADEPLARLLSPKITAAIASEHKGRVIGFDEVKRMLDAAAQAALVGCEDDRCVLNAAKAVAVDYITLRRIL